LTTKHFEWKYEQEVRLISLHYASIIPLDCTHPLNPGYYFNYNDALTRYDESIKAYDKCLKFINPSKIIYGWNCSNNTQEKLKLYKELQDWTQQDDIYIESVYLSDMVNYLENKFAIHSK
jgi:hypothetical protein